MEASLRRNLRSKMGLVLIVFLVGAGLDYALVRWNLAVKSNPLHAALWAVAVGGIGSFLGYVVYNLSTWYVIPELAGFFVGTYIAARGHGKSYR